MSHRNCNSNTPRVAVLLAMAMACAALYVPASLAAEPPNPADATAPPARNDKSGTTTEPVPDSKSQQGPAKADPSAPPPTVPQASPGDSASQPTRGQGTVKGSSADRPDKLPGGKAGSGGHKTNEYGR